MDRKFVGFLLVFGALCLAAWAVFGIFILPILPESGLKSGLAMLGYSTIFIVLALVMLDKYERENPEDD